MYLTFCTFPLNLKKVACLIQDVMLYHHTVARTTPNGYSNFINAVKRQRNLGLLLDWRENENRRRRRFFYNNSVITPGSGSVELSITIKRNSLNLPIMCKYILSQT
jgi:hypothetical protein